MNPKPLKKDISDEFCGDETAAWSSAFASLEVQRLIRDLGNKRECAEAAKALGTMRATAAVPALAVAMENANEDLVRRVAAEALVKIGDSQAIECLINVLDRISGLIKCHASADYGLRDIVAESLGKIRDSRAVVPLIAAGCATSCSSDVQKALVAIGDPAVVPLIDTLRDPNGKGRTFAARVLGKLGDPRAVPHLKEALDDSNEYLREEAAIALGELGDSSAIQPLLGILCGISDYDAFEAARVLGKFKLEHVAEQLLEIYTDKKYVLNHLVNGSSDSHTRSSARVALSEMGEAASGPLRRMLEGNDAKLKRISVEFISTGKFGIAAEPLIKALSDTDPVVRMSVAKALGNLGDKLGFESLCAALKDSDEGVRRNAILALREIGDERAVDTFIAALKDSNRWVRWDAVKTLAAIGDGRAVQPMLDLAVSELEDHDKATICALESMLEKFPTNIPTDDLESIAKMDNAQRFLWQDKRCVGIVYDKKSRQPVDCSALRQIARQELIRRGCEVLQADAIDESGSQMEQSVSLFDSSRASDELFISCRDRCSELVMSRYCRACHLSFPPERESCDGCGNSTEPAPREYAVAWAQHEFPELIQTAEDFDRIVAAGNAGSEVPPTC